MANSERLVLGEGAVAVVDALGFKAARMGDGAVERLVQSVRATRQAANSTASLHRTIGGTTTHVAAFSDSIIIATLVGPRRRPGPEITMARAIDVVASAAAALLNAASATTVPLAYRGCVGIGDLCATDDLFVGHAIDEAAEWYEQADAALIWLTPAAERAVAPSRSDMLLLPWAVPLKGRGALEALCVNPFYQVALDTLTSGGLSERIAKLESALLESFGRALNVDIARKLQNTRAFLERAKAHTLVHLPAFEQGYLDAQNFDQDDEEEDEEAL